MTGHRAGVAEAEVDVVVAVDAANVGARRRFGVERERPGPLDHPGHRDALEEGRTGLARGGPPSADARSRSEPAPSAIRSPRRMRSSSAVMVGAPRGNVPEQRGGSATTLSDDPAARDGAVQSRRGGRALSGCGGRSRRSDSGRRRSPRSRSRKLAQPLVEQKSFEVAAARRRRRRMAVARPVTDAWVVRVIMLVQLCFLARRHREMSDRLRGRGSLRQPDWGCGRRVVVDVLRGGRERRSCALTGSSRQTGYSRSMGHGLRSVKDSGLFIEAWLNPPRTAGTLRPDRGMTTMHDEEGSE